MRVVQLQDELQSLSEFREGKEAMDEKLALLQRKYDTLESERAEEVEALHEKMKLNDIRWATEMHNRSEEDHAKLQSKIEAEVFDQFQTIQTEHGQMKSELRYQSHRIHALMSTNQVGARMPACPCARACVPACRGTSYSTAPCLDT